MGNERQDLFESEARYGIANGPDSPHRVVDTGLFERVGQGQMRLVKGVRVINGSNELKIDRTTAVGRVQDFARRNMLPLLAVSIIVGPPSCAAVVLGAKGCDRPKITASQPEFNPSVLKGNPIPVSQDK